MMGKLSLRDIAKEAGVSVTTVSFVLNGKAKDNRISDAITRKVERIIKEKKFTPNTFARGLRTGKTMVLGLMVEDIGNFFFGNVAKTIELTAYQKGYKVIFTSTDNDEDKAKDLLLTLKHQQVDGYIVTPTAGLNKSIAQLQKENKPIVLFDRYFPELDLSHVILDNFKGAYEITSMLIRKGHKKIAFITIKSEMAQMRDRLQGYLASLQEHGLDFENENLLKLDFKVANSGNYSEIDHFIKKNKKITAIFFATNYLGILGLESIIKNKISIPDELAVVSFDDHDLFRVMKPAVTVVAQPIEKLANAAINTLLYLLESKHPETRKIKISPQIILRESV
jgi:LacI family transcriptional regulator